jgi:putative ABC transport system ATP-binding protein
VEEKDTSSNVEYQVKAPILEAIGLTKVFHMGDNTMVSPATDISLQVGYGDFAVIFGPSGAGKSTIMNILLGLEKPDLGEVFLKGSSLYNFSEEKRTIIRRRRISYLTQAQYWIDYLSIIDNVALPLVIEGQSLRKARKQAEALLTEIGLGEVRKHKPEELSTGQQQKAALARALIKKPWIIYADEPTAHLDTKSVDEVTTLLLTKAKEYGITIIMVTHDLNFLKLSNKWFFMQDGRLWDIKDRSHPFTSIKEAVDYVTTKQPYDDNPILSAHEHVESLL